MPQKPTGTIGPIIIQAGPSGVSGGHQKIKFPTDKGAIEQLIVEIWAAETRRAGGAILSIKRNEENDFDFTVELPRGTVSLDLVELFYRDANGRPYDGENIEIDITRFAVQIRDTVMKKSRHYGRATDRPIHLLVYITHWRFWPMEVVIRLAQHLLLETPPIIENVFLLAPFDANTGTCRVLFPSRDPLEGKASSDFKDQVYWVPNPTKATIEVGSAPVEDKPAPSAD
jgi:hypothetical protein